MRRAIGMALVFLSSLPLLAGTLTAIDPASIQTRSGEHWMTASGSNFSEYDEFIFDGPSGRFVLTVNSIDIKGNITGWVPESVVNTPGNYTLTVRSWDGYSSPMPFTVYKPGRLPLQLHLPEMISAISRGSIGAAIKYDFATTGGDGSAVSVKCDPESGSIFPLGTSMIYCTAYDLGGGRDEQKMQVIVWDGVRPKLSLPYDIKMGADTEQGAYVKFEVSATDDVDREVRVLCDRDSGALFPNGATKVTCEATDSALNVAVGSFNVWVEPHDPGVLKLEAHDVKGESYDKVGVHVWFDGNVTAYGSADPDPVIECYPASGSYFRLGETKVGCTATDDFGARAEAGFIVYVSDAEYLRTEDIAAEATSPSGAEVTWDLRPTKNWTAAVTCTPEAGSLFAFGETTVECSTTSPTGDPFTGQFKVTVADTTAPHIQDIRATLGELNERGTVPVSVDVQTIDAGDAAPRCSVTTLTSDTTLDWTRTSELSLELRQAAGRAFRVQVDCVDTAGNRSTASIPLAIAKGKAAKVQ
jgi:HYR domain